jgi:hypothetical protein
MSGSYPKKVAPMKPDGPTMPVADVLALVSRRDLRKVDVAVLMR